MPPAPRALHFSLCLPNSLRCGLFYDRQLRWLGANGFTVSQLFSIAGAEIDSPPALKRTV